MSEKQYRVRRLYRNILGWQWWLQHGEWLETGGIVGTYTGRPKRVFRVDFEESYPTKEDADKRLAEIERR